MDNSKRVGKQENAKQKNNIKTIAIVAVVAVLIIGFIVIKANSGGTNTTEVASGDLEIIKSEITENAKFYPYKVGKTNMEVLAVKASDGTIRTAFNTCQVCYDSGRGYYKQQGNQLICQNCGNRFELDQVEKARGGCNPVPVMGENKTDDETKIVISGTFMEKNKGLFGNWRKK